MSAEETLRQPPANLASELRALPNQILDRARWLIPRVQAT